MFFRCPGVFSVLSNISSTINSVPPNKSIYLYFHAYIVLLTFKEVLLQGSCTSQNLFDVWLTLIFKKAYKVSDFRGKSSYLDEMLLPNKHGVKSWLYSNFLTKF